MNSSLIAEKILRLYDSVLVSDRAESGCEIQKLFEENGGIFYRPSLEELAHLLEQDSAVFETCGVEESDEIQGAIYGTFDERISLDNYEGYRESIGNEERRCFFIGDLIVDPSRKGRGIGSGVLSDLLQALRIKNEEMLVLAQIYEIISVGDLECSSLNIPSSIVFKKNGFIDVGSLPPMTKNIGITKITVVPHLFCHEI